MSFEDKNLVDHVIKVARDAAETIMATYKTDFEVIEKADNSPVTEADLMANHIIIDGLTAYAPTIPTLSEESDPVPFGQRKSWKQYWLIDPLDGTREFIKRSDEFTINIALIKNHTPVMGLVMAPAKDVIYYATQGGGAYKITGDEPPVQIRTDKTKHDEMIMLIGHHVSDNRTLAAFRKKIGSHEFRRVGSSLKSCLIAEGEADIYTRFGPTCEWDTAAAQCVIEEAGGKLTDVTLKPLRYNTKDTLLNPYFIAFGNAKKDWARILREILDS